MLDRSLQDFKLFAVELFELIHGEELMQQGHGHIPPQLPRIITAGSDANAPHKVPVMDCHRRQ
jgi:hypothetical protein